MAREVLGRAAAVIDPPLARLLASSSPSSLLTTTALALRPLHTLVLRNPRLSSSQLEGVLDASPPAKTRALLASHPELTPSQMRSLARKPARDTVLALVCRPDLPADIVPALVVTADKLLVKPLPQAVKARVRASVVCYAQHVTSSMLMAMEDAPLAAELLPLIPGGVRVDDRSTRWLCGVAETLASSHHRAWPLRNQVASILQGEFPLSIDQQAKLTRDHGPTLAAARWTPDANSLVVAAHGTLDAGGVVTARQLEFVVLTALSYNAVVLARKLLARPDLSFASAVLLVRHLRLSGVTLPRLASAHEALVAAALGEMPALSLFSQGDLDAAFPLFVEAESEEVVAFQSRWAFVSRCLLALESESRLSDNMLLACPPAAFVYCDPAVLCRLGALLRLQHSAAWWETLDDLCRSLPTFSSVCAVASATLA